jgi:L-fuculose-phosphate aldolase
VAFTIAGLSLEPAIVPEVVVALGAIPTLPYQTTGTEALANQVGEALLSHDAVLLDRHGSVSVGSDLLEAFCRLEVLEHTARIIMHARSLGAVQTLDPEESIKLRLLGLNVFGGAPNAVAQLNSHNVDLPSVSTRVLPQPSIPSEAFENRQRLIQP